MTYVELQNAVMDQLGLTSSDARRRVKSFLKQRYREVQSSVNVSRTRLGSVNFVTASGVSTVTASGVAKVFTVYDPTNLKRPLVETTLPRLRELDTDSSVTGYPTEYAIVSHVADAITLRLYPKPNAVLTLPADVLVSATELSADDDVPALPVDFHDILVRGAKADYLMTQEKAQRLADKEEKRFAERLADLRLFLRTSSTLHQAPYDRRGILPTSHVYPYGGQLMT